MTTTDTYSPYLAPGNGSTVTFSSNQWGVLDKTHLKVDLITIATGVRTPQVEGSGNDYVATVANNEWSITFNTAPAATKQVLVYRNVLKTQGQPYKTSQGFDGKNIESSFDKLTQITQDISDDVERSIKFDTEADVSGFANGLTLNNVKGKILYFDETTGEPSGLDYSSLLDAVSSTTPTNTQTITADGGASYTLSFTPANKNRLLVFIEGAVQKAGDSYDVSGTSLTFTQNVTNGYEIFVVDLSGAEVSLTVPNGHINTDRLADGVVTAIKIGSIEGEIDDDNGNVVIKYDGLSNAVNYVSIANSATTGDPSITAVGGDTNISMNIVGKGTGGVKINGAYKLPTSDGDEGQFIKTDGSGELSFFNLPAAWCTFDGTGSDPITIDAGRNVANVTKNGTGDYTINFTNNLSNANYAVMVSAVNSSVHSYCHYGTKAVGSVNITTGRWTTGTTQSASDLSDISVVIFNN